MILAPVSTSSPFVVLHAVAAGAATVTLIASVWTAAQYLLAWCYGEDLSDRDTPFSE